jgi:geranylgeranyl pyrophosphate synthase
VTATALASLEVYTRVRRLQIERALDLWAAQAPACPEPVVAPMRYSLLGGGKRLRPILTLAAAEAVSLPSGAPDGEGVEPVAAIALPAACAIEMIHTYSLVHDDLPAMDDDSLRRGRPTCHVVYGDGLAILAGDGLLTDAFALLANAPEPGGADARGLDEAALATRKLATVRVVASAAGSTGMVGGQAIDLQGAALDAEGLRDLHARKTGALIRASAVAGAIMAGAPADLVELLDEYAADLGLAYQIVDDILDVEGAADELGKSAGKDAAAGKPTYPALFGLEASRRLASETTARAVARAERTAALGAAPRRLVELALFALGRTR